MSLKRWDQDQIKLGHKLFRHRKSNSLFDFSDVIINRFNTNIDWIELL